MEYFDFLKKNYISILFTFNIILFTETITLLFLFIPSQILSSGFVVLVFYLLFITYFIVTLLVPWLNIFFVQNQEKYVYIFGTSIISFSLILLVNSRIVLPVQVVIYFILLKSLMVGFASIFKSVLNLIDKKTTIEKTNFSFQKEEIIDFKAKTDSIDNFHNKDFFYGFFFLILYPFIILSLTYFYELLNL